MVTRIFAVLLTSAACLAGTAAVQAQVYQGQVYQGGQVYAPAPQGYPPQAAPGYQPYPPQYRRPAAETDFDALDDDDTSAVQGSAALPSPGPVLSPNDPRYGRPIGPPPVIYSDRPAPAPVYSERGPQPGFIYRDSDGLRPPQPIGPQDQPAAVPRDPSQPLQLSALPPEEQPEMNAPKELPPHLKRQEVYYATKEPAGTIVVDTPNTHLYYILGGGRAIRYGVRVGRDGFTWTGVQKITKKAEWPDWHPPPEMIERQPYLPRFMAGGDGNPLGARALYLGATTYRIHGTNQPSTIGKFVSSGCVGMLNEDVSDLFERAKVGTRVVVLPGGNPAVANAAPGSSPQGQGGYTPSPAYADRAAPPMPPGAASRMDATTAPPLPPPVQIR